MVERARGTFIDEVPEMRIDGGLVIISAETGDYVMRPSLLRKYVDAAGRLLTQWETEQRSIARMREAARS